jgi:formate hydrogenlyase subunit 3/multisubunit Na+/H+ antiporter MnhD subunit
MSEGPASSSRQPSRVAGIVAVATAATAFLAVLWWWRRGGGGFDTAWLPSWDARLAFRLDGLGALYAVLATGVGVAVFAYATAYVGKAAAVDVALERSRAITASWPCRAVTPGRACSGGRGGSRRGPGPWGPGGT